MRNYVPLLAVLISTQVFAQVDCAALDKAWINAEKEIARSEIGDFLDTSAIREGIRVNKIGNAIASQNGNLVLMQQAKCPIPPTPAGSSARFFKQALACRSAKIGAGTGIPDECKSQNWVPSP